MIGKKRYLFSGTVNRRVRAPGYSKIPVRKNTGPSGWPLLAQAPLVSSNGCWLVGCDQTQFDHSAAQSGRLLPATMASLAKIVAGGWFVGTMVIVSVMSKI